MAAPAEEGTISPEYDVLCSVCLGVGCFGMTYETDGFAVYLHDLAFTVQHDVWIDLSILFSDVTFKAKLD